MITSAQCRAARALIDWSREDLAGSSKVALRTVVDFEREARDPRFVTIDAMQRALEAAGVEFIPGNGGGPGVRLAKQPIAPDKRSAVAEGIDTTARDMADLEVNRALKGVDASRSEKVARREKLTKPPRREAPQIDDGKRPEDLDASNDD